MEYKCLECGRTFSNQDELIEHIKNEHSGIAMDNFEEEKYICPHCGKEFKSEQSLVVHISKVHKNSDDEDRVPTPEELVVQDRLERLKSALKKAPGASKAMTEWIIENFKDDPTLYNNPQNLYMMLISDAKLKPTVAHRVVTKTFADILDQNTEFQPFLFPLPSQGTNNPYVPMMFPGQYNQPIQFQYQPPVQEKQGKKLYTEEEVMERVREILEEKKKEEEMKRLQKEINELKRMLVEQMKKPKETDDEFKEFVIRKFEELEKKKEEDFKDNLLAILLKKVLDEPKKDSVSKEDLLKLKEDFLRTLESKKKDEIIEQQMRAIEDLKRQLANPPVQGIRSDEAAVLIEGIRQIGAKMEKMSNNVEKLIDKIPVDRLFQTMTMQPQQYTMQDLTKIENTLDNIQRMESTKEQVNKQQVSKQEDDVGLLEKALGEGDGNSG